MPFRRAQPPPDLERVASILGGGSHEQEREREQAEQTGWVPVLPPTSVARPSALDQLDADLRRARRPGVVTAPEPLRLGRWWVSSATVLALIALVVAVACIFAVRVLWVERSANSAVAVTGERSTAGVVVSGTDGTPVAAQNPLGSGATSGVASRGSGAGGAPSPPGAEIVVHVVGQVVKPGLVRLTPGARVADAVAAAGGARPGADLAALNLARLVVDGEQLHVPKPGEAVPSVSSPGSGGGGGSAGGGSGGSGGGATGGAALVSLNTADVVALDTLPGVGPVLAQRIVDWRAEHGRFTSVDELGEVSGIGDKLLAKLRPRVSL
jgi:competence protein ComEA